MDYLFHGFKRRAARVHLGPKGASASARDRMARLWEREARLRARHYAPPQQPYYHSQIRHLFSQILIRSQST